MSADDRLRELLKEIAPPPAVPEPRREDARARLRTEMRRSSPAPRRWRLRAAWSAGSTVSRMVAFA